VTGFPPAVRAIIHERSGGMCERCGEARGTEIHHRRPRGMGGSTKESTNTASNGVLLCSPCHAWVESHRTDALLEGFLVLQIASPRKSAVKIRGVYMHLDDNGNLTQARSAS
jgi:5-methylcytosine-specific restriction enzyme A